jgi:hypothetical protein
MSVFGKEFHRTAFALLMFVISSPAWADAKVHDSTTLAPALMKPYEAEIEQLAGVEITILPSSTTRGLADLVQGKTDSAIAGNSQTVMLVGQPTSAEYRIIREALAISYASDLRIVQNTNQTPVIVMQAPGALGNISSAHDVPERGKFKVVETPLNLPLHLYLAIRKDAPEHVKRVVDTAASLGGR